jgi:hypothetical protein
MATVLGLLTANVSINRGKFQIKASNEVKIIIQFCNRQHKNADRHQQYPPQSYADRSYSLPRTMIQPHNQMAGYYTTDRRNRSSQNPNGSNQNNHHRQAAERSNGADTPDFYFMPSQRKYSGEVVRVYVDYNKDPK